ncbi:hypothetical protein ACH4E7_25820 [Kitasatospora sp. NPDC018058]
MIIGADLAGTASAPLLAERSVQVRMVTHPGAGGRSPGLLSTLGLGSRPS